MSLAILSSAPRRRFTAEEVQQMVEAGVLGEDEPLELIEGELIEVSPQGPLHINTISRLNARPVRA